MASYTQQCFLKIHENYDQVPTACNPIYLNNTIKILLNQKIFQATFVWLTLEHIPTQERDECVEFTHSTPCS